jgi:hypothetical protein
MFKFITTIDDKKYLCEEGDQKFGSKTTLFDAVEIDGEDVCECCGDNFEYCECTCGCTIGDSNCHFDWEDENYLAKCYVAAKLNESLEIRSFLTKKIASSKNKSKVGPYVNIMLEHIEAAEKKIRISALLKELYAHLDS